MVTYLYYKISGYISGERILVKFGTVQEMNFAILTDDELKSYVKDFKSVQRVKVPSSSTVFREIEGDVTLVCDIDGGDVDNITASVQRYSPLLSDDEILNGVATGFSIVRNANNTPSDGSMIKYWRDNQDQNSNIDLDITTFRCPSCGKLVSTSKVHGAHVTKGISIFNTLYLTPTCESCNTSKTNRLFKVETIDLVVAPPLSNH